jgi:hypothetical protein
MAANVNYNWQSVRALAISGVIGALLAAFGWAPLHGRASVAEFIGFTFALIAMGGAFAFVAILGILQGTETSRERPQSRWGLAIYCLLFVYAIGAAGFGVWLLRK